MSGVKIGKRFLSGDQICHAPPMRTAIAVDFAGHCDQVLQRMASTIHLCLCGAEKPADLSTTAPRSLANECDGLLSRGVEGHGFAAERHTAGSEEHQRAATRGYQAASTSPIRPRIMSRCC
jgi:hypothetical protein